MKSRRDWASASRLSVAWAVAFVPPGAEVGNQRAADIVPDAEDGARQCRFRAEVFCAEGGTERAVLHADFDHDSAALGAVHSGEAGGEQAKQVAEEVVQDDNGEDDHAAFCNRPFAQRDDAGENQDDADDGNERQGVAQHLQVFVEVAVDEDTGDDRQQDHFDDGEHHRADGDVHGFVRVEFEQERRQERREQGGAGGDGDAQGDIAAREVGHDVAGGAAGAAADEDDAERDHRVKAEDVY